MNHTTTTNKFRAGFAFRKPGPHCFLIIRSSERCCFGSGQSLRA